MLAILKSLLSRRATNDEFVYEHLVQSFINNPEFPWLVSFPRTGSHWLRMLMELYFEKPSLVRAFYFSKAKDFTCYHRHDDNLEIEGVSNVIYIFRNPVSTVYSNLQYFREDTENEQLIKLRTHQYSDHLNKWLIQENFTNKKLVLTYEGLKGNLGGEFKKVVDFFDLKFDELRFDEIAQKVSKAESKKRTSHDNQVVNTGKDYNALRKKFREDFKDKIVYDLFDKNPALSSLKEFQSILKDENN